MVNLRRMDGPPGLVATGDQAVDLDDQLAENIAAGAVALDQETVAELAAIAG
ncbi:hypothetical protein GCM10029964_037870 [Kibdelosporangium lantanae]